MTGGSADDRLEAGTSERTGRSRTDCPGSRGAYLDDHSHRRTYEGTRSDEPLDHGRDERLMNDEDWSWILGDGEDIEDALEHYVNLAQDWDEWSID
jgi:hypothetical protein